MVDLSPILKLTSRNLKRRDLEGQIVSVDGAYATVKIRGTQSIVSARLPHGSNAISGLRCTLSKLPQERDWVIGSIFPQPKATAPQGTPKNGFGGGYGNSIESESGEVLTLPPNTSSFDTTLYSTKVTINGGILLVATQFTAIASTATTAVPLISRFRLYLDDVSVSGIYHIRFNFNTRLSGSIVTIVQGFDPGIYTLAVKSDQASALSGVTAQVTDFNYVEL